MTTQINPQDSFNISINNNQPNNRIGSSSLSLSTMNNDIIIQLIELGKSPLYSKRIFQYYHPKNIQEAVDYLSFENGIIQHIFVQDRNNNENSICYLCGEKKDIHLSGQINNSLSEDIKESNIRKSFLENRSKLTKSNGSIKKTNCPACEEDFIPYNKNTLKNCGHSFCDECWYDFLSIRIKENKLTSIKCMDYECSEKPDDDFIINILNSNQGLINLYKRFKLELEIINDPNRKFCPFPNCNSFLELKDKNNKEVKCSNNHIFCFLCLNAPHGNLPCNNEMSKSMIEYEKNNFVKKCPKCDIITEKIEGCNHISCPKCNHQWCWLCNEEFDPEHFYESKCRGLQFYIPKDENEIKLAQEGKIELRECQMQDDLDFENSNDEHFVANNFNNNKNSNININNNRNEKNILMEIRKEIISFMKKTKKKNKPVYRSACPESDKYNISNNNKSISIYRVSAYLNHNFFQDSFTVNETISDTDNKNSDNEQIIYNNNDKNNMNEYNTIKSEENYNKKNDIYIKNITLENEFKNCYNLKSSNKIFYKEDSKSENNIEFIKIKSYNLPYSVLITFIYLIFGHFFIPLNIYLIENNLGKVI